MNIVMNKRYSTTNENVSKVLLVHMEGYEGNVKDGKRNRNWV